jgi:hypothetical protein
MPVLLSYVTSLLGALSRLGLRGCTSSRTTRGPLAGLRRLPELNVTRGGSTWGSPYQVSVTRTDSSSSPVWVPLLGPVVPRGVPSSGSSWSDCAEGGLCVAGSAGAGAAEALSRAARRLLVLGRCRPASELGIEMHWRPLCEQMHQREEEEPMLMPS